MSATAVPEAQVERLMDGFLITQLLYVAARLGVADELLEGPRSATELALAVGARTGPLGRVLRGLAIEGVVEEREDGRFALTAAGARLAESPGPTLARGEIYYRAAGGLLEAVRDGGVPFERVHGESFFAHLDRHPDRRASFEASMAARSEREARDVVAAYDFAEFDTLIDVGGGRGVLLSAILDAVPRLRGALVERPAAVHAARSRFAALGLDDRCECIVGDFFTALPRGADAYLLSRVLHDWDDARAVRILGTCRAAMPPDGRLLIVEAILPEQAIECPEAVRMDLHMLILFGARERGEAEYRRLLGDAGLTLRRCAPTGSPAGLAVLEAIPSR
jgi:orsellinic acid C2-O-methyltransferase